MTVNNNSTDKNNKKIVYEGGELQVHFIDVGQADSIFINFGDYDILIDGGNNGDGQLVVDYLKELDTDDIEIMVATHNHEDHVGGLDDVIYAFEVEKIIDSGYSSKSKTYSDYINAIKEEDVEFMDDDDLIFKLAENVMFEIIETGDSFKNDTNNYSIVSLLRFGEIEFLFTGDMEEEAKLNALDKFQDVEVLKVGHHGSYSSSSEEFLDIIKPEFAVISCGVDNRY